MAMLVFVVFNMNYMKSKVPFDMVTSYLLQNNMYQARILFHLKLESSIGGCRATYFHKTLLKYNFKTVKESTVRVKLRSNMIRFKL